MARLNLHRKVGPFDFDVWRDVDAGRRYLGGRLWWPGLEIFLGRRCYRLRIKLRRTW